MAILFFIVVFDMNTCFVEHVSGVDLWVNTYKEFVSSASPAQKYFYIIVFIQPGNKMGLA